MFANMYCNCCSFPHQCNGKEHKFHIDSFHRTTGARSEYISLLMLPQLPLRNHLLSPALHEDDCIRPLRQKPPLCWAFVQPRAHHGVTDCTFPTANTLPSFICMQPMKMFSSLIFWWKSSCKKPDKPKISLPVITWWSEVTDGACWYRWISEGIPLDNLEGQSVAVFVSKLHLLYWYPSKELNISLS